MMKQTHQIGNGGKWQRRPVKSKWRKGLKSHTDSAEILQTGRRFSQSNVKTNFL